MQALDILILVLATWRISSLVVTERGPHNIFGLWRDFIGIGLYTEAERELGKLFSCTMCLSVWVGAFVTLFYFLIGDIMVWMALPLALSTGAIVIDGVVE